MTMSSLKHSILVLISGNGSNLQALIDATHNTDPDKPSLSNAQVVHVISNRKNAFGLQRAKEANIGTTYHNLVAYKKKHDDSESGILAARQEYDDDLAQKIINHDPKPDLVVCAGWMHILSEPFVAALKTADIPIINLHPALPGQFDGANAIGRAWEAFQRGEIVGTGVMIHHVIGEVDAGRPIITKDVMCIPEEPQIELEARIHEVEWALIVEGTAMALDEIESTRRQSA